MLVAWQRVSAVLVVTAFTVAVLGGDARATAEPTGEEAPAPQVWPTMGGVQLLAADPDDQLTFLLKTDRETFWARYFDKLCVAPCQVNLPAGNYIFGLKQGDSRILQSGLVSLRGDETLRGRWVSRRLFRVGGAMVGLLAMLEGFVLISKRFRCHSSCDDMFPPRWLGPTVTIAGMGLLFGSQFLDDRAEIDVGPP